MPVRQRDLLLDVTRLVWRVWQGRLPTGIDRVCLAYLDHYAPRALAVVQRRGVRLVLDAADSDRLFALLRQRGAGFRTRLAALLAKVGLRGGAERKLTGWPYLNLGHTGLDSPGLAAWLKSEGWRPVFLVHDLIPISHPRFCRPGEARKHRQRMRAVLDCAAGVIVNSAATGRELAAFAARIRRPVPPLQVAWLGVEAQPAAAALPPSPRPCFVMVGTIEARKNHLLLLRLWQKLVQDLGDASPELVLIGQRGWEADDVLALLDHCPILRGHVRELGRCDDATMLAWLDRARALLMPSFIEGFGLPVIEAMQRGLPVIASDLPVFREIAGDIPLYLSPDDAAGWEAAVRAYCGDAADRARQLARLPGYRPPTWQDHFAKVDLWLASL